MEFLREKKSSIISDTKIGLIKAQKYCAYQERCQQEVRNKLYEWGLWKDAVEEIISELINENFLNEERFAIAYAGGKFRIKKWGRTKIKLELKKRNISDYCIKKALKEVVDKEYEASLKKIIKDALKKYPLKRGGMQKVNQNFKIAQYAISRGYEAEMVWEAIKEMRPEK